MGGDGLVGRPWMVAGGAGGQLVGFGSSVSSRGDQAGA